MSALLLPAVLSTEAVPEAPTEDGWVAYIASDGTHGLARMGEILGKPGVRNHEGWHHCYGTAPIENTCTLRAYTTWPDPEGIWVAGWFPPTVAPNGYLPMNDGYGTGGALVASTHMELTGDVNPETKVLADCSWATGAVLGFGPGSPPFLACRFTFIHPPGVPREERYPGGNLTASFRTGAYDPSLLPDPVGSQAPSTSDVEAGVGTWHAILYAD